MSIPTKQTLTNNKLFHFIYSSKVNKQLLFKPPAITGGFFFVNFIVIIVIIMKLRRNTYMLSVTEISDKLQISKIMVYRFIKDNKITHSAKDGRTFLYDNIAFQQIFDGLKDKISENIKTEESYYNKDNDMIIDIMRTEIENKNKLIDDLTEINKALNITLQQQQQLLLYEQQKNTKLLEENIDTKKWWQWWK